MADDGKKHDENGLRFGKDWFDMEPYSIEEPMKEMELEDEKPFGEFDIPKSAQRLNLKKGQLALIPNHVTYDNMEGKILEESDSASDPEEDELEWMEEEGTEFVDYTAAMARLRIDHDGSIIDWSVSFPSQESAGDFAVVSSDGQSAEIECRLLFDYHSGYSLLDLDLIGGQKLLISAEEYETFLLGQEDDEEWKQLGLPTGYIRGQKYSLVRNSEFFLTNPLGLVPSSYLVSEHFYLSHPSIFIYPNWYLGICSFDQALDYLMGESHVCREGLFVLFSPRWLNLDPEESRPFILLMLTSRDEEAMKNIRLAGNETLNNFEPKFEQMMKHADRTDAAAIRKMKGKELELRYGDEEDMDKWKVKRTTPKTETTDTIGTTTTGATFSMRRSEKKSRKKLKQKAKGSQTPVIGAETVHMNPDRARWQTTMIRETAKKLKKPIKKPVKKKTGSQKGEEDLLLEIRKPKKRDEEKVRVRDPMVTSRVMPKVLADEPLFETIAALTTFPYAVMPYTIKRSYSGDFELFGKRYPTLYHLVLELSQNQSELQHRLLVDRFVKPPPFNVVPMEPPLRRVKRSPNALPMKCEQWATNDFSTVTEPFYYTPLVDYTVRSFANKTKKLLRKVTRLMTEKTKNEKLLKKKEVPPDEHSLRFDPRIVVDKEKIGGNMTLLGSGNFGKVYKTILKIGDESTVRVVIKEFRVQSTSPDKQLAFVQEIEAASAVCHVNIAKFYGVATSIHQTETCIGQELFPQSEPGAEGVTGNVHLVFEFCDGPTLESFVKETDKEDSLPERLSSQRILDFLMQIARALAYLHTRSPAIVHGDVALRNVMILHHPRDSGRFVLKLIDFGLAKFCRADTITHYDSQTIPAPWLPLESLKNGELSVTTDVWSFGCVVWEMFGGTPWGATAPIHQGIGMIGQYLQKPDRCPDFLYNLMLLCHRPAPHDRISMVAAEDYLEKHWIENEGDYLTDVFKSAL